MLSTPLAQQMAEILRAERERQGLTQVEVARRMGAATTWIQNIEYNRQPGRQISAFQRYADALNIDLLVTIERKP
jgi:transcriptional regulator with XRE-family HTH domain